MRRAVAPCSPCFADCPRILFLNLLLPTTNLECAGEEAEGKGKGKRRPDDEANSGPDWVKRNPRKASRRGLYAVALSWDSRFLAVGGGDRKVCAEWSCVMQERGLRHASCSSSSRTPLAPLSSSFLCPLRAQVHIFDGLTGKFVQSFPGHRDAVTALAFREGSHQLFSASLDRTVKMWSLDDRAYMDTLFGHQAEVLSLDVLRAERAVTGGSDHSVRIWKVPEESQLVFRAPSQSTDCVRLISQAEFISGGCDGTLQVWNQLRKKPMSIIQHAHGAGAQARHGGASAGCISEAAVPGGEQPEKVPDVTGWLQSVAVCRNSDLVASGASDGCVRVWRVGQNKMGGAQDLSCIGGLPVRGCVNGLAFSKSGQLLVAAVGQEPRLGRWMRDARAKNGIAVYRLEVKA